MNVAAESDQLQPIIRDRLTRVRVDGFRSFEHLDLELGDVTVLIGANGSGKSNIVDLFRLLREIAHEPRQSVQIAIERRGGAAMVLHYGPKVTERLRFVTNWTRSDEHGLNLIYADGDMVRFDVLTGPSQEQRIPAAYAQFRVHHFHDTSRTAAIRQNAQRFNFQEMDESGGHLAAVLQHLRETQRDRFDLICRYIRLIYPAFVEFELVAVGQDALRLKWRERGRDYLFDTHQASDGTIRFFALTTLLLTVQDRQLALLVIDEPELGLHPAAVRVLADLIRTASEHVQVVIGTQSMQLLDEFPSDAVVVVDRHAGASRCRKLDPQELAAWRGDYVGEPEPLSSLWERGVLGGMPSA